MRTDIVGLLRDGSREWHRKAGAERAEIASLVQKSPTELPEGLIALLGYSNGGEGNLALPPLYFVLNTVDEIIRSLYGDFETSEFPGLIFFGGNGGLERIAFDTRDASPPWPIVMVDPIAGLSSVEPIASCFDKFALAIGLPDSTLAQAGGE